MPVFKFKDNYVVVYKRMGEPQASSGDMGLL
jgi:hypothetical protein